MKNKITSLGKLSKEKDNLWVSHNAKNYKCFWLREHEETYTKFRMRKIEAYIQGDDTTIHQQFTEEECKITDEFCRPKEQKKGILVWEKKKHNFKIFNSLGQHEVHQFGTFFLIGNLGISGVKLKEQGNMILLENSYIIKRISGKIGQTKYDFQKFMNFSKTYAKTTEENVQREILEGRITRELIRENRIMATIAANLCRTKQEVRMLQSTNLNHFTDSAENLVFGDRNRVMIRKGDAILIGKCKEIRKFRINWQKKINKTCFKYFPTNFGRGKLGFLELETRRILKHSPTVKCHLRARNTHIRDVNGEYPQFVLDKGFRQIKIMTEHKAKAGNF